jgi:hypothetical protein
MYVHVAHKMHQIKRNETGSTDSKFHILTAMLTANNFRWLSAIFLE